MGEGSPGALQEAAFEEGKMSLLLPPGLDLVRGYGLLLEVTTETLMTGTSGLLGAPLGKPKAT